MSIPKDIPQIAAKLSSLDLTGVPMKDAPWLELMAVRAHVLLAFTTQVIPKLEHIETLNLDGSLSRSGPIPPITQALVNLVQTSATLTSLSIAGFGYKLLYFKLIL